MILGIPAVAPQGGARRASQKIQQLLCNHCSIDSFLYKEERPVSITGRSSPVLFYKFETGRLIILNATASHQFLRKHRPSCLVSFQIQIQYLLNHLFTRSPHIFIGYCISISNTITIVFHLAKVVIIVCLNRYPWIIGLSIPAISITF